MGTFVILTATFVINTATFALYTATLVLNLAVLRCIEHYVKLKLHIIAFVNAIVSSVSALRRCLRTVPDWTHNHFLLL